MPSPSRHPAPAYVSAALAVALAIALLLAGAPQPVSATAHSRTLIIDQIGPEAAGPGVTVTVRGRVRSAEPPTGPLSISLRVGRTPLGSRGELARQGDAPALPGVPDARVEVPAGQTDAAFALEVPANSLALPGFGVYPMSVTAAGAGAEPVRSSTFLPWAPRDAQVAPTRLIWLWPLVDRPHRDPQGLFFDDDLAASLDGGRLARLLQLPGVGVDAPQVTWVVDPQLLEDARAMRTGYRIRVAGSAAPVRIPRNSATPSPGRPASPQSEAAGRWLARYDDAVGVRPDYMLPYATPDLSAMVAAGQGDRIVSAFERARALVGADRPGAAGRDAPALVWPVNGLISPAAAEAAVAAGATSMVLHASALPRTETQTFTTDARIRLSTEAGPATVLVPDPVLSDLVARSVSEEPGSGTPALVRQRFLAETAMIAAERPRDSRTVLIAPPQRWEIEGTITPGLLPAIRTIPWLEWAAPDTPPLAAPDLAAAAVPAYPPDARRAQLPQRYLADVAGLEAEARAISTMVDDDGDMLEAYLAYGLRLRSSALRDGSRSAQPRDDTAETGINSARGMLTLGRQLLAEYEQGVRIVSSSVTLGARDGPIPVTVVNTLPVPVRVKVELTPRLPRLVVRDIREVTVAAGRKAQLNVPASGVANGDVVVDAQLMTPSGRRLGPPVPIDVGITNVGAWGSYLTVGGAVMFVLAALVRGGRRVRARRRQQAAEAA